MRIVARSYFAIVYFVYQLHMLKLVECNKVLLVSPRRPATVIVQLCNEQWGITWDLRMLAKCVLSQNMLILLTLRG